MTTTTAPERNAILLGRLSDNREDVDLTDEGIPASLDDQVKHMRKRAAELGWNVYKVIQNPRLSAYKKRKVTLPDGTVDWRVWRPDLREALGHLISGRANALLALDLDRAFRDPRDLQDLINVVENSPHSVIVESVTGSLHIEKGHDNFDAEIRVLVANKSSRDTARRVAMSRERRAREGRFGGGPRPLGFDTENGILTVRQDEADVIKECSERVLQIDERGKPLTSLRSLAAELRAGDVPTATGAKWTAQRLREILLRPLNAGLSFYKDEEVGCYAFEPIVDREVWQAVVDLLTDPSRRTNKGTAATWLGTGIFLCGVCGDGTTMQVTRGFDKIKRKGDDGETPEERVVRAPRYRCKEYNHLTRNAAHVDKLIEDTVVALCSDPKQGYGLVRHVPDVDVAALRAERKAITANLNVMAADQVVGRVTREQLLTATERGQTRQAEIDELLKSVLVESAAAKLFAADDVRAAWHAEPLSSQRAIVRELMTVTIKRAGRRGSGFDPDSVEIIPNRR